MHPGYVATANALVDRIKALGEQILPIKNPFDLFKLGLKCDDLSPSLAQASFAMIEAQQQLLKEREAKQGAQQS